MPGQVAVIGPVPFIESGLVSELLHTEFRPEQPDDLRSWVKGPDHRAVLLAVETVKELNLVVSLRQWRADVVVVVLIAHSDEDTHAHAVRAGAAGIAEWGTSIIEVAAMIEAGLLNRVTLPTEVARRLLGRVAVVACPLSDTDRELLQGLAAGDTVAKVAARVGYSERETFRRLKHLYRRMGVDGRGPAIVRAVQWGVVD